MRIAVRALPALVLALAFAAPADARPAWSCAAGGSQTVRENSVARVYWSSDDDLIACSKRTGRRTELLGPEDRERQLRLRGHWVAFAYEVCLDGLGDECFDGVELVHVARAESVFRTTAYALRVQLKRSGGLAWSDDEGPRVAIYKRDAGGERRRLDRGSDVDPESLRLDGSTLEWRRGDRRRTATLR